MGGNFDRRLHSEAFATEWRIIHKPQATLLTNKITRIFQIARWRTTLRWSGLWVQDCYTTSERNVAAMLAMVVKLLLYGHLWGVAVDVGSFAI